jgi:hypothetical protein
MRAKPRAVRVGCVGRGSATRAACGTCGARTARRWRSTAGTRATPRPAPRGTAGSDAAWPLSDGACRTGTRVTQHLCAMSCHALPRLGVRACGRRTCTARSPRKWSSSIVISACAGPRGRRAAARSAQSFGVGLRERLGGARRAGSKPSAPAARMRPAARGAKPPPRHWQRATPRPAPRIGRSCQRAAARTQQTANVGTLFFRLFCRAPAARHAPRSPSRPASSPNPAKNAQHTQSRQTWLLRC